MPNFGDDLYLGPAYAGGQGPLPLLPDGTTDTEPSPMNVGVGPLGRIYVFDIIPATVDANGIIAAAAVAGAGSVALNGALVSGGVVTLDRTGRCLTMVSSDVSDTTQTVTVTGTDMYNQSMTETRTLNGTTAVSFLKAFYKVTDVTASALMAGTLDVGTRDAFGLPVRVTNVAYITSAKWDSTLADNAGTFTAADTTSPATATTGDVRGTFAQAGSASNGTRRLVMGLMLTGLAAGPNATRVGAFGVTQV